MFSKFDKNNTNRLRPEDVADISNVAREGTSYQRPPRLPTEHERVRTVNCNRSKGYSRRKDEVADFQTFQELLNNTYQETPEEFRESAFAEHLDALYSLPLPVHVVEHIGKYLPDARSDYDDKMHEIRMQLLSHNSFAVETDCPVQCHSMEIWGRGPHVPDIRTALRDMRNRPHGYYRAMRFSCTGEVVEAREITYGGDISIDGPPVYDYTPIIEHADKCQTDTTDIRCHKAPCNFKTKNIADTLNHAKFCLARGVKCVSPASDNSHTESVRVSEHISYSCYCSDDSRKGKNRLWSTAHFYKWSNHIRTCWAFKNAIEGFVENKEWENYAFLMDRQPHSIPPKVERRLRKKILELRKQEIIPAKLAVEVLTPCGEKLSSTRLVNHLLNCLTCACELCTCRRRGFGDEHTIECPYAKKMARFCFACKEQIDHFNYKSCACWDYQFYREIVPKHLGTVLEPLPCVSRRCRRQHFDAMGLYACFMEDPGTSRCVDVHLPEGTLDKAIAACVKHGTVRRPQSWLLPPHLVEAITNVCDKISSAIDDAKGWAGEVKQKVEDFKANFNAKGLAFQLTGLVSDAFLFLTGEVTLARTIAFLGSIFSRSGTLYKTMGDINIKLVKWAHDVYDWVTSGGVSPNTEESLRIARAMAEREGFTHPMRDLPVAQAGGLEDIASAVGVSSESLVTGAVTGVVGLGVTLVATLIYGSLPKDNFVKSCVTTITSMGNISRGLKFTIEGVQSLFSWIYSTVYEKIFGVSPYAGELAELSEEFNQWMTDVARVKKDPHKITAIDKDKIAEITQLYSKGLELGKKVDASSLRVEAQGVYRTHWTMITSLHNRVQSVLNGSGASKAEPTVVLLAGLSGVGKSTATPILAADMLNQVMGIETDTPTDYFYNRNIEQEYWDGYQTQPICIYDDFGQMKDGLANPNLEYMEIIRTANTTEPFLHMAAIEDKSNTAFRSNLIICSSNVAYHDPKSINAPEAVRRRFDLAFWVEKNPEYNAREKSMKFSRFAQYDPKVPFHPGDVKEWLSYEQMAIRVAEKYLDKQAHHRESTKFFADRKELEPFLPRDPSILPKSPPLEATKFTETCQSLVDITKNENLADIREPFDVPEEIPRGVEVTADMVRKDAGFNGAHRDMRLTVTQWPNHKKVGIIADLWKAAELARDVGIADYTTHGLEDAVYDRNYLLLNRWWWELESCYLIPTDKVWAYVSLQDRYLHAENDPELELNEFEENIRPWVEFVMAHCTITPCWTEGTSPPLASRWKYYKCRAEKKWKHFLWANPKTAILGMIVASGAIYQILKAIWRYRSTSATPAVAEAGATNVLFCENVATHSHETMERGQVYNHAHRCESCGVIYRHTHRIKPLKDSLRYGAHMCPDCRGSSDPHAEVTNSGDPHTQRVQQPPVKVTTAEVTSSGDPNTARVSQPPIRVRTAENQRRPEAPAIEGVEPPLPSAFKRAAAAFGLGTVAAEMLSDTNSFNLRHKSLSNQYMMYVYNTDGNFTAKANVIIMAGRIGHTVDHLRCAMEQGGVVRLVNRHHPAGIQIPIADIDFKRMTQGEGYKDSCWMNFPNTLQQHPNISNSLMTAADHSRYNKFRGVITTGVQNDHQVMNHADITACDGFDYEDGGGTRFRTRRGFTYQAETKAGDCGSPIFIVDGNAPRKIVGIHVAGEKGRGFGMAIFKEEYEKVAQIFGPKAQVSVEVDSELERIPKSPEGNFMPLGTVKQAPGESKKTKLRESLIHGLVSEPTTKPAALDWIEVDGKIVHPKDIGLKKAGVACVNLDNEEVSAAMFGFLDVIHNNDAGDSRQKLARVLTDDEMIRGIEGERFAPPIQRATSPGYPWSLRNPKGGKRTWIPEEGPIHDDLAQAIAHREERARNNLRTKTYWVDTLKDERRPIAKVDAGKTRVFAAGPVDFTALFRKYYLGFAAFLENNRIYNEVSVGTNPYSFDWQETVHKVTKFGNNLVAGDFSNFDGTLQIQILQAIGELINEWYEGTEEETRIRSILWHEIVNSVHLNGHDIYGWNHGQPSGCPLTAILNCCYNSIAVRYVWNLLARKYSPTHYGMVAFVNHVSMVAYGDDNIIGVSSEVKDWFNQATLTEGFAEIGMTYTNEDKTTGGAETRPLEQVSYLKRNFRWEPKVGRYVAPLAMESILETMNWVRTGTDIWTATSENIANSLFELALHGKMTYEMYVPNIRRAVRGKQLQVIFPTWEEQIERRLVEASLGKDVHY